MDETVHTSRNDYVLLEHWRKKQNNLVYKLEGNNSGLQHAPNFSCYISTYSQWDCGGGDRGRGT